MSEIIEDNFQISHETLLEYSDHTMSEFIMEIYDLRKELDIEKKAHAADKFARQKAEAEIEKLNTLINNAINVLTENSEEAEE